MDIQLLIKRSKMNSKDMSRFKPLLMRRTQSWWIDDRECGDTTLKMGKVTDRLEKTAYHR